MKTNQWNFNLMRISLRHCSAQAQHCSRKCVCVRVPMHTPHAIKTVHSQDSTSSILDKTTECSLALILAKDREGVVGRVDEISSEKITLFHRND